MRERESKIVLCVCVSEDTFSLLCMDREIKRERDILSCMFFLYGNKSEERETWIMFVTKHGVWPLYLFIYAI